MGLIEDIVKLAEIKAKKAKKSLENYVKKELEKELKQVKKAR